MARRGASAKLGPRLGSIPSRRCKAIAISAAFNATLAQLTTGAWPTVNPRSRQAGTVMVRFTVGPDGNLISRAIEKSSGSKDSGKSKDAKPAVSKKD